MAKPMRLSDNFPSGLEIGGVPLTMTNPGKVYYVHKNDTVYPHASDNNKGTDRDKPLATIDAAINKCTASRGDLVLVLPGHTETVSAASGIDLDVIGVAVVGLGHGNLRPTITMSATASTITVDAAGCMMHNLLILGGIDAVVSPVVVSAADCVLSQLELRDSTGQMTDGVLTTDAADRLKILNHIHDGAAAAGTNAAIALVGGDNIEITIDRMDGNFAVGGIDVRTTATTDLHVHDVKYFRTRNAADIFLVDTITASTGQIGPDIFIRLQDDAANVTEAVTGATFVVMDPVYVVNAANEKGLLINWTATADAIV